MEINRQIRGQFTAQKMGPGTQWDWVGPKTGLSVLEKRYLSLSLGPPREGSAQVKKTFFEAPQPGRTGKKESEETKQRTW
jgi:hypothetical protein